MIGSILLIAITLFILAFYSLTLAFMCAHYDAIMVKIYKKKIKHLPRACVRFIFLTGISLIPFSWSKFDRMQLAFMIGFACASFWLYFEKLFNRLIDKEEDFVGTTATTDKIVRFIFGKNVEKELLVLKWVLFFIFLIGAIIKTLTS